MTDDDRCPECGAPRFYWHLDTKDEQWFAVCVNGHEWAQDPPDYEDAVWNVRMTGNAI